MYRFLSLSIAVSIACIAPSVGQPTSQVGKRSESVVHIEGQNYRIHTIEAGETLASIARLYGVSRQTIESVNPLAKEVLKVGRVVKIPVGKDEGTPRMRSGEEAKIFDRHTVERGETMYSVARNYGIALPTLTLDNPGVDPAKLSVGTVLNIRKGEQGGTTPSEVARQWEEYSDAASRASEKYIYHIVKQGETLYSLSRAHGVAVDVLIEVNGLTEGLKAGSMVRIPTGGGQVTSTPAPVPTPQSSASVKQVSEGVAEFRARSSVPEIALMLPLEGTTGAGNDFVEFYKGALMALEDLKGRGHSLHVTLYDTARNAEKVSKIVSEPGFPATDLIIGPVYESEMEPAVRFAEAAGVPIVSPLVTVRSTESPALWQMAPDPATKYEKLRGLLAGRGVEQVATEGGYSTQTAIGDAPGRRANVILVSSTEGNDTEFEREITAELAAAGITAYGRHTIGGGGGDVGQLIDWERPNVLVVLARSEIGVNGSLTAIASAYNNASARRARTADIAVVGSAKWGGYGASLDKNLFFKLNVHYVTSYYADRSGDGESLFEARFLEAYGDVPSRAAYRGYDALSLFGGAFFGEGLLPCDRSGALGGKPLGTTYCFVRSGGHKRRVNNRWTLVAFTDDYNINVR